MGHESRDREQAEKLGKFNVHIEIEYLDCTVGHIDAFSWEHKGDYLAIVLLDRNFQIINTKAIKGYHVRSLTTLEKEEKVKVILDA